MGEEQGRQRWRMSLDELCHVTNADVQTLERWSALGALGSRWRQRRDQGKWRHITREVARRAVIMSRLVAAGIAEEPASRMAMTYYYSPRSREAEEEREIVHSAPGYVRVVIPLRDLP